VVTGTQEAYGSHSPTAILVDPGYSSKWLTGLCHLVIRLRHLKGCLEAWKTICGSDWDRDFPIVNSDKKKHVKRLATT